jgi:cholesterol oxidase
VFDADWIVIGSGFGGSVSALRLVEKGYSVVVLEQGRRYRPEDFPRTNWSLRRYLWAPRLGLRGIQGLTFLRHALVLHGCGVGGGSLVYANTLVQPGPELFRRQEWGGGDWNDRLAPAFEEARRMLGAVPCAGIGVSDGLLRSVAREMQGAAELRVHDVGVYFGTPGETVADPFFGGEGPSRTGCTRCSACMIGCRVGAKNTLDRNYLWLAERRGARIVPETEATGVRPIDGGWAVESRSGSGRRAQHRTWRTRRVVVAGGVLGSVRLLLRSRARGSLPGMSDQLGRWVRTNSEAILGADGPLRGPALDDHVAITSGLMADEDTHVEIVRFNRGSDALFLLAAPLVRGVGVRSLLRRPGALVRALWPFGRARRTAIVLAMQPTSGQLELGLEGRRERLASRLQGEAPGPVRNIPVADELARRLAVRLGGDAWTTWPDALAGAPATAHVLGGCRIGRSPREGVVDGRGEVYGHPGLHVVDGSVIPVNLGVNPSLTITAVAESILERID